MRPAVNPVFLTGHAEGWPLAALAEMGYAGLEVTPGCLERSDLWLPESRAIGMPPVAVNAMPELRPYLTGSLSDNVAWRRRETVARLTATLSAMAPAAIPFLIVAPSRLAEIYQTEDEARALLVASLIELSDAAPEGVSVLVEGAPFRLFGSSVEMAALVDDVGRPNVAAALNVGHALLNGEDPVDAARVLSHRLRYVQVHDADARVGVPRLDRHLPLGHGSLTREAAREAVGELPWSVTFTAPDDPLSAARSALDWMAGGEEA